jgi:hypothetical protein
MEQAKEGAIAASRAEYNGIIAYNAGMTQSRIDLEAAGRYQRQGTTQAIGGLLQTGATAYGQYTQAQDINRLK